MKYIYTGQTINDTLTGRPIITNGQQIEGELVELSPEIEVNCIAAPCPSIDATYGLRVKNDIGSTNVSVDDLTRADGGLMDEKGPTGFLFSLKMSNKSMIITAVAVLFLLGLYFNKQIRSFFNA